MAGQYDWKRILVYATEHGEGNCKRRWKGLCDAIARHEFPGPAPDYTSFWRHCRTLHADEKETTAPASVGVEQRSPTTQVATSEPVEVRTGSLEAAIEKLNVAEAALQKIVVPLLVHCPLMLERTATTQYQHLNKRIGRVRATPRLTPFEDPAVVYEGHVSRILEVAERTQRFVMRYQEIYLTAVEHGSLPCTTNDDKAELSRKREFPIARPDSDWGVSRAVQVQPRVGDPIGRMRHDRSSERGQFRRSVIAPVLDGRLTSRQARNALMRLRRGCPEGDDEIQFPGISLEYLRKYKKLCVRTIEIWVDRAKRAVEEAVREGQPIPSLAEVLSHPQPKNRKDCGIRTESMIEVFRRAYLETCMEHGRFSAAGAAQFLRAQDYKLSDRTAQRMVEQDIPDEDRLRARGGPAVDDVLFRSRLFQAYTRPNDCWMMDHSFVLQEYVDWERIEEGETFEPYERFPIPYCVERRNFHGAPERVRKDELYVTMIVDACTRRTLALRTWDHVPCAWDTLSILWETILEFGVPRVLYTDNGGDFRAHVIQDLTFCLGIRHAFSMPYIPEGRGIIESRISALKQVVFPYVLGFYGNRGSIYQPHSDDLPTQEEVEAVMWQGTELLLNGRLHSRTGRIPTEHYDQEIGARGFNVPDPIHMVRLFPSVTRVRQTWGISMHGLPYWAPGLDLVPEGAPVIVYQDPSRWQHCHVCVEEAKGAITYLGVAEWYCEDHPAPDLLRRGQLVAALRAFLAEKEEVRLSGAAERNRRRIAATSGEAMADAAIGAVNEELANLDDSPEVPALNPGPVAPESAVGDGESPAPTENRVESMPPVSRALPKPSRNRSSGTNRINIDAFA